MKLLVLDVVKRRWQSGSIKLLFEEDVCTCLSRQNEKMTDRDDDNDAFHAHVSWIV